MRRIAHTIVLTFVHIAGEACLVTCSVSVGVESHQLTSRRPPVFTRVTVDVSGAGSSQLHANDQVDFQLWQGSGEYRSLKTLHQKHRQRGPVLTAGDRLVAYFFLPWTSMKWHRSCGTSLHHVRLLSKFQVRNFKRLCKNCRFIVHARDT